MFWGVILYDVEYVCSGGYSYGSRSLRQLLPHIPRDQKQRWDRKQGPALNVKVHPPIQIPFVQLGATFLRFLNFPNSNSSWGLSIETLEPLRVFQIQTIPEAHFWSFLSFSHSQNLVLISLEIVFLPNLAFAFQLLSLIQNLSEVCQCLASSYLERERAKIHFAQRQSCCTKFYSPGGGVTWNHQHQCM